MSTSRCFLAPPQKPGTVRLYCFAHAGGNALGFIPWRRLLHPAIELVALQLPGRGARSAEPAATDFACLAARIAADIGRDSALPSVFFGHSMGALLAFEVARACRAQGQRGPGRLLLSGCAAPRRQAAGARLAHLDQLSDDALLAAFGGLAEAPPQSALRALMRRQVAALRADLALMATYRYRAAARLALPLTLLYGRQDRLVAPRALAGWARETSAACALHGFYGDHFFVNTGRAGVVDLVQRTVMAAAPTRAAA